MCGAMRCGSGKSTSLFEITSPPLLLLLPLGALLKKSTRKNKNNNNSESNERVWEPNKARTHTQSLYLHVNSLDTRTPTHRSTHTKHLTHSNALSIRLYRRLTRTRAERPKMQAVESSARILRAARERREYLGSSFER